MTRRRSRRRGRSTLYSVVAVAVVCLLLVGGVGLESAAFDTASAPRAATADVTADESGAHSLDTAGAVHVNATEPLVNVTNRLGRDVTVTVALRADSTGIGDLVVDGADAGDVTTFSLGAGNTQAVEIRIPDNGSLVGETVYFHANATATGLDVNAADRAVPVESG